MDEVAAATERLSPVPRTALKFAALAEALTGLALLSMPSLVGRLLLGEDLSGPAVPVAHLTGIALIALGFACWRGPGLVGMFADSLLATLYLGWTGSATGALLWPAVGLHGLLTALLAWGLPRRWTSALRRPDHPAP